MPFNLLKKYPELLEIMNLDEYSRKLSLEAIFRRDIEDNDSFKFRSKQIYPIKSNGQVDMQREFMHLTTMESEKTDANPVPKRIFDQDRSQRLHWIRHHIEERTSHVLEIFSCVERDIRHRKDVYRTYLYDRNEKYVIVLEPQHKDGYYLLTAYYLNKPGGKKKIEKSLKKKLGEVL